MATIGSRFSYLLADGSSGGGIPPILPQLLLPQDLPGGGGQPFTLSWQTVSALLPAAFSMAMLGAIESLLCAVVLDGMTGKTQLEQRADRRCGQHHRAVLRRHYRHRRDCPFGGQRARRRHLAGVRHHPRAAGAAGAAGIGAVALLSAAGSDGALLLMVARNMSRAHKVIYLLRRAPKDDILVLLLCMSLTVLFDMVIAITVGIVLASLLFMRRIARMTRLSRLSAGDGRTVLRVNGPLFFAAAERIFTELLARSGLARSCCNGMRCRCSMPAA